MSKALLATFADRVGRPSLKLFPNAGMTPARLRTEVGEAQSESDLQQACRDAQEQLDQAAEQAEEMLEMQDGETEDGDGQGDLSPWFQIEDDESQNEP